MGLIRLILVSPLTYAALLIAGLLWMLVLAIPITPGAYAGLVGWGIGLLALAAVRNRQRPHARSRPEKGPESLSGPTQAIAVASGSIVGLSRARIRRTKRGAHGRARDRGRR